MPFKPRISRYTTLLFLYVLPLLLLSACGSTVRAQKEARLALLTRAVDYSTEILAGFQSGDLPPEHDVHLYLSYDVLNEALAALDDYQFPLPNDPSVIVVIQQIRIVTTGALPTVSADIRAKRESLTASIATGLLLTPMGNAGEGTVLRPEVLSFVPRVSWWQFELANSELVRALLAAEARRLAGRLPAIELPTEQKVTLGGPAQTYRRTIDTGNNSTLLVDVHIPSTQRDKEFVINRYVYLTDGLHLFGSLI